MLKTILWEMTIILQKIKTYLGLKWKIFHRQIEGKEVLQLKKKNIVKFIIEKIEYYYYTYLQQNIHCC